MKNKIISAVYYFGLASAVSLGVLNVFALFFIALTVGQLNDEAGLKSTKMYQYIMEAVRESNADRSGQIQIDINSLNEKLSSIQVADGQNDMSQSIIETLNDLNKRLDRLDAKLKKLKTQVELEN